MLNKGYRTKGKANNSKEQEMALLEDLKRLITKVENDKGEDMADELIGFNLV